MPAAPMPRLYEAKLATTLAGLIIAMVACNDPTRAQTPSQRFRPPGTSWSFGVQTQETNTGARVTAVDRNSPAQQLGLEPGDLIVTVDGQQVGRVNGRRIDANQIIAANVQRQGRATLLIQDRRNLNLLNATVTRNPGSGGGGSGSGGSGSRPGGGSGGSGGIGGSGGRDPLAQQVNQINTWHQAYLGRPMTRREELDYRTRLNGGASLTDIQNRLLASDDYYRRNGNRPYLWVTALFRDLLGRQPNEAELKEWLDLFAELKLERTALITRFRSRFKV